MIKASNPIVKDGLGIFARLIVIALLLGILSALLQGCSGNNDIVLVKKYGSTVLPLKEIIPTEVVLILVPTNEYLTGKS